MKFDKLVEKILEEGPAGVFIVIGMLLVVLYATFAPLKIDFIAILGVTFIGSGVTFLVAKTWIFPDGLNLDSSKRNRVILTLIMGLALAIMTPYTLPWVVPANRILAFWGPTPTPTITSTPTITPILTPTPRPTSTPEPTTPPLPTIDLCLPEALQERWEVINPNNTHRLQSLLPPIAMSSMPLGIEVSGDGETFIISLEQQTCLYRTQTVCRQGMLKPEKCYDVVGLSTDVSFSLDGEYFALAMGNGQAYLYTKDGQLIQIFGDIGSRATSVAFEHSRPATLLAFANDKGLISLWNISGKKAFEFKAHQSSVHKLDFTSDSQILISASADNTVKLWNVNGITPTLITTMEGHSDDVRALAFNLNGDEPLLATAGDDGIVQLWQPSGHTPDVWEKNLILRSTSRILSVAFNPNGQLVLAGDANGTIQVWDTYTAKSLQILSNSAKVSVVDLTFILSGRILVSVHQDNTVNLWGVPK